jgi:hypothetical protein
MSRPAARRSCSARRWKAIQAYRAEQSRPIAITSA